MTQSSQVHPGSEQPSRIHSSAFGVGGTGQGAILAGPAGPAQSRTWPGSGQPPLHHMVVEEAVAVASGRAYPDPRAAVLIAHMSGGDINPSPAEFWFDDGTREAWYLRARRNLNQA